MNVAIGRVVYTSWLDENGGFRADLTVMRLAADRFRVVTGGATGMSDAKWISDHLPARGVPRRPHLGLDDDRAVGAAGPGRAGRGDGRTTCRTRGSRSAPAGISRSTASSCSRRGSPTSASSAGNCTCRSSRAPGCGTRCGRRASRTAWCRPASASTAPPGGWRRGTARSAPSSPPTTRLVEAGMTRPKVKEQAFVGKDAYLRQRAEPPCAVLCTLTVDSNASRPTGRRGTCSAASRSCRRRASAWSTPRGGRRT